VREGEEVPKKGWFSRNKQRPPGESMSTSTPHSTSITPVGQTQKPDQQAGDDGDLPPREVNASEAPTSTPHAPGTVQQPNDVADDIASELPPRAGFDLAAMRAVIDDIEGDRENRRTVNGFARLETPPPLPPQGTVKKTSFITSSPERTPISEYSPGMHTPATSVSHDFKFTSTRPLSLNDTRDARGFGSHNATGDADEEDSTSSIPSSSTFTPHSRVAPNSTLSFKGDYKASWIPGVSEKDAFGGYGTPVGNPFHSTPFAAVDSTAVTALSPKTSNASPAVPIADRDLWSSLPSYSGDVSASASVKKPSIFAANPWES
jgi:hypothetical protein